MEGKKEEEEEKVTSRSTEINSCLKSENLKNFAFWPKFADNL